MPGWGYIVVLLAAVALVAGLPYLLASGDARRPPSEAVLTKLPLPSGVQLADLQEARLVDVIDGDTIDVTIAGRLIRVRYFGVDTPERGERCYREAKDRSETLLDDGVLLLADARDGDRFGRSLRYVFLTDGVSVDATLVAEGFALAWRQDGRYKEEILTLEGEARAAGRGCLWR